MNFYKVGDWTPIENKPDNDPDRHYIMTALFDHSAKHDEHSQRFIMDCFFRFRGDEWQFYNQGEWHFDLNPNYKPIAYAEVMAAEPWEGEVSE